jgi:hypothetical protein
VGLTPRSFPGACPGLVEKVNLTPFSHLSAALRQRSAGTSAGQIKEHDRVSEPDPVLIT